MIPTSVDRIIEIERLLKAASDGWQDGQPIDEVMAERRTLRDEQKRLLSEVSLPDWEVARDGLSRIRFTDASDQTLANMRQRGGCCGHRRGSHNLQGCTVGSVGWNKRERRSDPTCYCHGFATEEAMEELRRTEVEEDALRAAMPLICTECDEPFEDTTDCSPLYECGECGDQFTRADANDTNRCPDCGKFGSKLTDDGCPECNQGEVVARILMDIVDMRSQGAAPDTSPPPAPRAPARAGVGIREGSSRIPRRAPTRGDHEGVQVQPPPERGPPDDPPSE